MRRLYGVCVRRCLSDWTILLGCAERAGVVGAAEALASGWGITETLQKIDDYRAMGVTAVPVLCIDPDPENQRARNAYVNAGFVEHGLIETPEGPAVLMFYESPEED